MDELFHYTKAQTALNNILVDKTLRLSQFQQVNDPKESKELYFMSFTGSAPTPSQVDLFNTANKKIHDMAKKIKLKEWKVLCFTQNHNDLESGKLSALDNPFLAGKYRPAMWAHYASSSKCPHDGVCLKFNYQKLNKRISETFKNKNEYFVEQGAVEYDDMKVLHQPPFNKDGILHLTDMEIEERAREYFFTYYKEIFLLKPNDWKNETEYRWLVHSKSDSPEYTSIVDVIDEVLVGVEFPQGDKRKLVSLCKELNIPPKRLRWVNGIPDEGLIV
jgi:hypothetical protein